MATQSSPSSNSVNLLKAAWLSILLGVGMEILVILAAVAFNKVPAVKAITSDLVQKISWSTIVCVGLALGTAASKMRGTFMGLAGLAAAPIGFYIARILHKSANQALAVAGPPASLPTPLTLALIKAVEYGLFGWMLSRLTQNTNAPMSSYVKQGVLFGLVFGAFIVFLAATQNPAPVPPLALVTRAVNELIFPIGCALVLYAAGRIKQ